MNLIRLKEYISNKFKNIRFVEKPTINELVIIKTDSKKTDICITITECVIRNQFKVRYPGFEGTCYNANSLLDLLEFIN